VPYKSYNNDHSKMQTRRPSTCALAENVLCYISCEFPVSKVQLDRKATPTLDLPTSLLFQLNLYYLLPDDLYLELS